MCNWRKWILPGILVTVLSTALAMVMHSGSIEQDLRAKAMSELSSQHDWAQVALDGRDLTLSGVAPSEEEIKSALAIADSAYDVRITKSAATLIPIADPYTLSAVKDETGKITLRGSVPNNAIKTSLLDSAKSIAGDGNVEDVLTLNRGAHDGFDALAGFGISQLANLTSGSAEMSGADLTVKGVAPSVENFQAIKAAAEGELPGGGVLTALEVTAPTATPYTFSATKNNGSVTLEGFVPSKEISDNLESAAKMVAESGEVKNNLQLALGAPEGFDGLAGFAIKQLTNLSNGSASLTDTSMSLDGLANSVSSYEAIQAAISGEIPSGGTMGKTEIVSPAISPYVFAAKKYATGITLSGHVPNEDTRAALLVEAAKVTDGKVIDKLEIGEGATSGFTDLASFGLAQFEKLKLGDVSLSNLDLNVRGTANSPQDYSDVSSALAGTLPGGGTLLSAQIARPTVEPFTFEAKKDDAGIYLDGYMASQDTIDSVVEWAKSTAPDGNVVNTLQVAGGVPNGVEWGNAVSFAIDRLANMNEGEASLKDNALTVSGIAINEDEFNNANEALANKLPEGVELASQDIQLPVASPFTWRFENRKGEAPRLSGYQPESEFGKKLAERIQVNLGSRFEVVNELVSASGKPEGFEAAAQMAVDAVSRMTSGTAEISDKNIQINGETFSEESAKYIYELIDGGLPEGFNGQREVTIANPVASRINNLEDCQSALTDNLKFNSIRFEPAKATIQDGSLALLDRLAFAVKRCPSATVVVEGHTDSDGSAEMNQKLSEDRANAVREFLVRNGIFSGRLKAIGFGETKPIADNSTDEGKAQNRRIEFTVVQ